MGQISVSASTTHSFLGSLSPCRVPHSSALRGMEHLDWKDLNPVSESRRIPSAVVCQDKWSWFWPLPSTLMFAEGFGLMVDSSHNKSGPPHDVTRICRSSGTLTLDCENQRIHACLGQENWTQPSTRNGNERVHAQHQNVGMSVGSGPASLAEKTWPDERESSGP